MSVTKQSSSTIQGAAFKPLYKQIKDLLLQQLKAGEWKPGESIPSELDLAERYKVSQGTVRKAIDELAAESVLFRRQGKGTFVATHYEKHVRHRFLRLASDNKKINHNKSEFLSCEIEQASKEESKLLKVTFNSELLVIKRLMYFDDKPIVFEEIKLPAKIFSGLDLAKLKSLKEPLYGFFEANFGISMIRAEEKLKAVKAEEFVANLLCVEKNHPLLSIKRVSYTYGDKPIEIRRGLYLTEQYFYKNSLN